MKIIKWIFFDLHTRGLKKWNFEFVAVLVHWHEKKEEVKKALAQKFQNLLGYIFKFSDPGYCKCLQRNNQKSKVWLQFWNSSNANNFKCLFWKSSKSQDFSCIFCGIPLPMASKWDHKNSKFQIFFFMQPYLNQFVKIEWFLFSEAECPEVKLRKFGMR